MQLTTVEKIALSGLSALWREAQQRQQQMEKDLLTDLEKRLGLNPGSIGTTHQIDLQQGIVIAIPIPNTESKLENDRYKQNGSLETSEAPLG